MNEMQVLWRVNIPELFGLFEGGLDDLGVDGEGNVYVGDGVNGSVYRFRSGGEMDGVFDVIRPVALKGMESGLNLAVMADSSLYVADPGNERVIRYDSIGRSLGEFAAPGLLSLCCAPEDSLYVFASDEVGERIDSYDVIGSRIEALCAPTRHRAHLDPELVSITANPDGPAYLSYGMPPYRVWCVSRTEDAEESPLPDAELDTIPDDAGSSECRTEIKTWGRVLDHPEDAVLISDLAFDPTSSVLWVLLACRESGRQNLDAFSCTGEFLGSVPLPHSDNLYSGICVSGDGSFYLLDGAAGELVRLTASV